LLSATHVDELVAILKLDGVVEGSLELGQMAVQLGWSSFVVLWSRCFEAHRLKN
jgi:hypothetical protein